MESLPQGWLIVDGHLTKEFTLPSFIEALAFVNKIGGLAESSNHHPDITISYTKVSISLITHDVGGITQKDTELALKINEIVL